MFLYLVFASIEVTLGVEGRPKIRRACLNTIDSLLDLQWNRPNDNCGTFTHFNLYGRDNPLNIYQLLGTYTDYSLTSLNIKLKNLSNWEFYLIYHTACNGIDSIYSDTIQIDNIAPPDSELDSVSIDLTTQKTIIGWSSNTGTDVMGYYVYYITNTNAIITSTSSLSYLDNGARDPKLSALSYGIAAFDSCQNASLISVPHSTIHLQSV
ncbi:MAG: hypothetical protein IT245_00405, partial [Bacteroidia bacterium]|nr:hypothetical protein [Bacteroidia bacterium]